MIIVEHLEPQVIIKWPCANTALILSPSIHAIFPLEPIRNSKQSYQVERKSYDSSDSEMLVYVLFVVLIVPLLHLSLTVS